MISRKKIDDMIAAIKLNSRMKGAYFFTPPSSASARRKYEATNSLSFSYPDVDVSMDTNCACNYVYFSKEFRVDGNKVTLAGLKKHLAKCAIEEFGCPSAAFDYLRANGIDALPLLKKVRKTAGVELRLDGRI